MLTRIAKDDNYEPSDEPDPSSASWVNQRHRRRAGYPGCSPFGVFSIDDISSLLADIQNRLPLVGTAVRDLRAKLPSWFRELGSADGIARAELHFGRTIPDALRLFYKYPAL